MPQRKEHLNPGPDPGMNWLNAFRPAVTPYLKETPERPKREKKRDLWGRLTSILATRLQTRHGLSREEARIRAEKLVRLSGGEPISLPPLRNKVVPIR